MQVKLPLMEAKPPKGESAYECESRAVPALYDCILNRPEKNMLFVCIFWI